MFNLFKHRARCCYGLSMDLLSNIATELGFEYHLYIVHDELFGAKKQNFDDWLYPERKNKFRNENQSSSTVNKYNNFDFQNKVVKKITNGTAQSIEQKRLFEQHRNEHNENYKENSNWKNKRSRDHWNGIVGDLVTGSADLSFAALSVTK